MQNDKPLLTIAIPTYNRAIYLKSSLTILSEQYLKLEHREKIELIVSDNCSPDETPDIIQKFQSSGLPIRYIRNPNNIGADNNILQCFQIAKGQYVWVLGDDDYLQENVLRDLIISLDGTEYGLIHITQQEKKEKLEIYHDAKKFLSDISIMVTFISKNIISTKYISLIDPDPYRASYFLQVPFYMTAALREEKNLLINQMMLDEAKAFNSNGSYNYFEVFIISYLKIWHTFMTGRIFYEKEKYRLFKNHVTPFIYTLLILRKRGNFKVDRAWQILAKYYGLYPYSYILLSVYILRQLAGTIKRRLTFH